MVFCNKIEERDGGAVYRFGSETDRVNGEVFLKYGSNPQIIKQSEPPTIMADIAKLSYKLHKREKKDFPEAMSVQY